MIDIITARIQARLTGETYEQAVVDELAQTMLDRLSLRLGVSNESSFPSVFYSVVVDATVKAWRRVYYEGLSSETSGSINTSFVEDILAEYEPEIAGYLDSVSPDEESGSVGKVVRFL